MIPALLVGALAAAAVVAGPAEAGSVLRVGVRADAAPFSFALDAGPHLQPPGTGPLYAAGFDGYVVHVCDAALEALHRETPDLEVEAITVTAESRFKALRDEVPAAERIDILCDPATVTPERSRGLYVSMPIYLSGISFAYRKPFPENETCAAILGAVAETTTETNGMQQILDRGGWPRYRAVLNKALRSPEAVQQPVSATCDAQPVVWAKTHTDLANEFCDQDSPQVLYYVGDVEIVRSQLALRKETCGFGIDDATYTEERYAIYARIPEDPAVARDVLRFFAILGEKVFTDPDQAQSVLVESYRRTFLPDYRPSRLLQAFYWGLTGDTEVAR